MLRGVFALLVLVAHVGCFRAPKVQWARPRLPNIQLDEGDRNYISHEVSDPDVGPHGITALKDPDLEACFIYKYMKPLIIPRVQRHFYTRTKTATVLLTPRDKKQFRQSVGPAVDKLCNSVKSFWLDEFMLYQYMSNQLYPRNAPPPPVQSSDLPEGDDENLAPAMIFPTPPPLHETHVIRTPPPLPNHEVKAPPGLARVDHHGTPPNAHRMKVPPPLHEVKTPPALERGDNDDPPQIAHRMRTPPPLMRAPPPL
ncbi:uncharacterized protein LOC124121119 [Haliotis rufescens]|uniref:uncharacterized protein LOC124121119 n=1 Tax=Haliotis rufescens TaxID=6454 RepID=UPI00201F8E89|nr:uncharacterized protein LOC124121119 [Haliotis rufescens]